ncbi:hypothetical protein LTR53_013977, partial [Teratosphaeriaceae sp. CCFEE 6253]
VFLEPDEWNPMRWLEARYPTHQEPLSKYPTITQYSQFGYGRRTCQGMGVTEADLFVGLGSVAWLFSMAKPAVEEDVAEAQSIGEGTVSDPKIDDSSADEPTDLAASERSFFEQNAERIKRASWRQSGASLDFSATGLGSPSPSPLHSPIAATFNHSLPTLATIEDETALKFDISPIKLATSRLMMQRNDSAISIPGEFPGLPADPGALLTPPPTPTLKPSTPRAILHKATPAKSISRTPTKLATKAPMNPDDDPTMNFSTLLIAKPLPFTFHLQIRSQARAEVVMRKWVELRMEGEFEPARVFWGGGKDVAGDGEFGWGEVFA